MENAQQHFDQISGEYDYWKKKNHYYHDTLKRLFGECIPPHSRVWEIGCGTGDILAALSPSRGLGEDISEGMIAVAKIKYQQQELSFIARDIRSVSDVQPYDFVVLADVLEHVDRQEQFVAHLRTLVALRAKVIITLANPFWEPVLMLAERLHMKMPEGPHERPSNEALSQMFERAGFVVRERGFRLLVPKPIWGAEWVNKRFYKLPWLARYGFVVYWVLDNSDDAR